MHITIAYTKLCLPCLMGDFKQFEDNLNFTYPLILTVTALYHTTTPHLEMSPLYGYCSWQRALEEKYICLS